jgi:Winged helix DNA-binding domain
VSAAARTVIAERLASQLLAGERARDPLAAVQRLLAVQGQDQRGARLAIRARSDGVSAADVDRALSEDRTLLITWLNRGTLHLVASEDYPWLHALTTPQLRTGNMRRLQQEGVDGAQARRGVEVIERALTREGPLDRAQLRERLERAGVRTAGQALVHLLVLATLDGIVVRGPMIDGRHAYVSVGDWLGARPRALTGRERERALAELARRYLVGHAPADDRDLARWAGIPLRDARAGLGAIAAELHEREDGLLELARHPPAARTTRARTPRAPARLLGAFDPLLLGWCSREALLGENAAVVTVNGLFRPFALVNGRAVALWSIAGGELRLEPLADLSSAHERALRADARDVVRFLG